MPYGIAKSNCATTSVFFQAAWKSTLRRVGLRPTLMPQGIEHKNNFRQPETDNIAPIRANGGSKTHLTTQTEPQTVIASEHSERGNLLATENAPSPYSDKEIATTATQSRNDSSDFLGCLKTNNSTTEPQTVIASEQSERGNLLTTENAPSPYSDKKIATTATQSRNDSNDFSGCLKQNNNTAVGWVSNPPTTPTGVDNTNIITDNANIDFAPNGAMVGWSPYNANRTPTVIASE